jgi:hypothetical protein
MTPEMASIDSPYLLQAASIFDHGCGEQLHGNDIGREAANGGNGVDDVTEGHIKLSR